jgi:ketopantoate reductase
MGSLFASLLAEPGHCVTLIELIAARWRAIQSQGLRLDRGHGDRAIYALRVAH